MSLWGAGMAQWWERSPPTNVARVRFPVSYVGWVCCWFSCLLREVFLRVLRFSPLLKNQHIQIPIRSWRCPQLAFFAWYRWHLNKVIYLFIYFNHVLLAVLSGNTRIPDQVTEFHCLIEVEAMKGNVWFVIKILRVIPTVWCNLKVNLYCLPKGFLI